MKMRIALLLFIACGCASRPQQPAETGEIRRGISMAASREDRQRIAYEKIIRKIEPSLVGRRDRVPQYLELFKREFVEDTRTFAFDVKSQSSWGKTILTGYVEFPEHKEALSEFFKYLKLKNVVNRVELVPAEKTAIVRAERCFAFDRAEGKGETLTECLKGDVLFLLRNAGERVWCHTADGYVGYVDASCIERASAPPEANQPNPAIDKVIDAGKQMIGTKYVWGGRTREGIDCSGLVRHAFSAANIAMPRDADQQFLVGKLVATRFNRASLRRGDVLYFLGRRGTIHHTAIYLGDDEFLEASDPGVKISSFKKDAPNYAEKRETSFCFAKRVIE